MATNCDNVIDLSPAKTTWKIKVKIIRLWRQYSAGDIDSIEMVLIDSNGDTIQATLNEVLVPIFEPFLEQDDSKILINFSLSPACGSYRLTKHPYKISFIATTRIRLCDDLPYRLTGFTPVNFREILDGTLSPEYLIDIMGQIVEVSHVEIVSLNGKDTEKISLLLKNEADVRLPLVVWGKVALDLSEAIQLLSDRTLICGSSKIFINFSVGHSYGSYRTTKHPYKISFLETTRVRSCESPIEVSGFDPAIYRDILDGSLNSDYLVDVIGQIVKVSPIEVVTVNGKDTNKISLELRNSNDERLQTVLWGVFPTDVMEAIQMRRNYAIICVIRFGKINVWKDERSISNAYNVSDVSLNPPMVEVDDFIAVLPKDQLVLAIVDPKPLSAVCGVSQKDDFFVHTPRKTISQLSDARNVEKCIVMCTIASIDSDMGWYYLSCKVCAKKVLNVPNDFDEDGNDDDPIMFTYYCPNCKVSNPNLLPRYKLHLIVLDSTGSSKFVLFDNLAIQLLHQPCTELVGANADEIQDPAAIPLALNNLIGKTYLFKVGIERENYLYKNDTYIISKVITNHDIITEFQTIVHPKKPSVTYSCDNSILMVSDESSQECEGTDLTPAKRRGTLIDNLEAAVDHNSLTRSPCNTGIKKEKTEESG
ncbi:replication protein A 70 kDa DNA-binding subunit B-like [Brassica napus]|uniref:replication protein A 70 kDa DNA-binding subunit B-like n=1 Tax=Brassica napus TaxID=3708 RepID=UPI002078823F|nr:replication protein A 70 kDa DNA-binding subunit B-like [Brassica napus]